MAVRPEVTVDDALAIVAGAFAAIQHAGTEHSARLTGIILDGLRTRS